MISEEEKRRFHESSKCSDCVHWHKYCNAECCKMIFLNVNLSRLDEQGKLLTIKPKEKLSFKDESYYRFHDVECIRGLLRFKKERIEVVGRNVIYIHPCKHLKNNLCSIHDTHPELCKLLTLETAMMPNTPFKLTDNCLYKYKCKEVK